MGTQIQALGLPPGLEADMRERIADQRRLHFLEFDARLANLFGFRLRQLGKIGHRHRLDQRIRTERQRREKQHERREQRRRDLRG